MWLQLSFALAVAALLFLGWRHRRVVRALRELHYRDLRSLETDHSRALAEESARSHALVHGMVEGVLLLDAQRHIIMANAAMRELFNIGNEAVGHDVLDSLRLHQVHEIVTRTLQDGRAMDDEIEVVRLNEPSRFFQINGARIDDDAGRPRGIVLVFNDITRLKTLEQTRREFVANVSHELRTPLSIIKGYAETLATMDVDAAQTVKFANIVERHADRLTLLVDDLLTISSIESGQMELNIDSLNLHQLVQQVIDGLETRAEMRGVIIENDVADACMVKADAARLQQVLTNLIDNAIKYGAEEGRVLVEASRHSTAVIVSVSDDGPGIPADARDRVFERFYRLDKARSREQGGTGLGLAIVKHLVQAHGGRVWVEAAASGGAKFCFTLPV